MVRCMNNFEIINETDEEIVELDEVEKLINFALKYNKNQQKVLQGGYHAYHKR